MYTLELERVLVEAPEDVLELRDEIGGLIAAGADDSLAQPVVEQYAEVTSSLWADVTVDAATEKFGEDIENIGRAGIIWCCGEVMMKAVAIEAQEITKRVDGANHSFKGKLLRLLKRRDPILVTEVSGDAFKILDEEISSIEVGAINHVEDLRPIVETSAHKFIVSKALGLDERLPAA